MQAYLTRTLSRRAPPIGHEVIGGSVTEIDSFTGMALRTKEALRSRRAFAACARDDACYAVLPISGPLEIVILGRQDGGRLLPGGGEFAGRPPAE